MECFTLTSVALGLLVTFKTQTGYQRLLVMIDMKVSSCWSSGWIIAGGRSFLINLCGCSGCEYHWISISNLHSGVQQWNQLRQVFRIGSSEGSQKGDLCGAFWSMCSWHVAVTLFSCWTRADGAWARSRGLWPAEWWLGYLLRQVGLSLKTRTRTITWYMMMQWFNDDHENSGVCMTMYDNVL